MTEEQDRIRKSLLGKLFVLNQPYGVTYKTKNFSGDDYPVNHHFQTEKEAFYVAAVEFCDKKPRDMILTLLTKSGVVYSKWYGFRLEEGRISRFFKEVERK